MMSYTSGTRRIPLIWQACVTACLCFFLAQAVQSQQSDGSHATQSFVSRVLFIGTHRVDRDTLRSKIRSRPGDAYDAEAVQRDTQALRDTGYFDEVRLQVEDDPEHPDGKIVSFYLTEKPDPR